MSLNYGFVLIFFNFACDFHVFLTNDMTFRHYKNNTMLRTFATIVFCGMLFSAVMAQETVGGNESGDIPATEYIERAPDVLPAYPGGIKGLMTFLAENMEYPAEAVKDKIEGKVIVLFVVDKNGNVCAPEVKEPVHPLLDAEALRVVSLLSGFTPGQKDGRNVNVRFGLPVTFRL